VTYVHFSWKHQQLNETFVLFLSTSYHATSNDITSISIYLVYIHQPTALMMKLSYSFLLAFVTIASQNIATLTAFQQLLSPTTSIPTRLHSKQQLKSTTSSNNNNIDDTHDENDSYDKRIEGKGGISRRDAFVKTQASLLFATTTATTAASFATSSLNPSSFAHAASSTIKIPTINLGKSTLQVSRTIQGYWQLAGGHGKYNVDDALKNMKAHYNAGITTLDTADIYGPSEQIVGKFVESMKLNGNGNDIVPCTKFCCFRYLDEIDKDEVRNRINKVSK